MTISNEKPKLLGTDTHAASLTGSAGTDTHAASLTGSAGTDTHAASLTGSNTVTTGNNNSNIIAASSSSAASGNTPDEGQNSTPDAQVIVSVTNANSTVVFGIAGGFLGNNNRSCSVTIEESTVEVASGTLVMNRTNELAVGVLTLAVHNVSSGSHTYDILWNNNPLASVAPGRAEVEVLVIEVDDTHAASLTGSAGTDTHAASLTGSAGTDTHAASLTGSNNQFTRSKSAIQ